jgi:hypothetical protein
VRRLRGSHEDLDVFIPAVPTLKWRQHTMATLAELSRLGSPAHKVHREAARERGR